MYPFLGLRNLWKIVIEMMWNKTDCLFNIILSWPESTQLVIIIFVPESKASCAAIVFNASNGQPSEFCSLSKIWPILMALYTTSFNNCCEHNYKGGLAFPCHVPKVGTSGSQGTLRCYISKINKERQID